VRRLTAIFNDMVDTLQRWKKLERQISRMDRLASLGQMVAGVSHEIRNPLASMRIHLDLLSDHVSDEGTESLRILGDELDRLNRTVSQLLAFASPRPPLSGPVAVNDLIRWCHQMLHASLRAGITWDASLDDDGLELWGDPQQLRQMLLNLLLNAQEAMPGGGAVRLAARKDGNTVEFRVSDTGPGLPDVLLERIFDPFVTTKGDGTGLGLSIVHRIVELHGGHIEYTTSPRGTTFIVRIPAGREETRQ
jgi:signal transduction histidine kinase